MTGADVLTTNPFDDLSLFFPPLAMKAYVLLMLVSVVVGTVVDMLHKRSAEFFLRHRRQVRAAATRRPGISERAGLLARTLLIDVAAAGEFCNARRRVSHLLMFYGFLLYLLGTLVLVFASPTPERATPVVWLYLWNLGAAMVLIGGLWFFLFIRVDVAKEGHSPWRLTRADLFVVSLLASVGFALIWEIVQAAGTGMAARIAFGLYLLFSTLLFVGVPWSKFAHMFYKPAAAYQRRLEEADGSSDLPGPAGARNHRCPPSST